MNITVYLGALKGNDESLEKAVRELGTFIGKSGNTLIYGRLKIRTDGINCRKHIKLRRKGNRC